MIAVGLRQSPNPPSKELLRHLGTHSRSSRLQVIDLIYAFFDDALNEFLKGSVGVVPEAIRPATSTGKRLGICQHTRCGDSRTIERRLTNPREWSRASGWTSLGRYEH